MERFLKCAILAIVVVLLSNAAVPGIMLAAEKQTIKCVVEWEKSPASDTQMPPVTVAQLQAEFEKVAAARGIEVLGGSLPGDILVRRSRRGNVLHASGIQRKTMARRTSPGGLGRRENRVPEAL